MKYKIAKIIKHLCNDCNGTGRINPSGLKCWKCDNGWIDGYSSDKPIAVKKVVIKREEYQEKEEEEDWFF